MVQERPPLKVLFVCLQEDLLSCHPIHEAKGACPDGLTSKCRSKTLNFFSRHDPCRDHTQNADKRCVRLRQRDLQCVGVQSLQSLNPLCCPSKEFLRALHTHKEPGPWRRGARVQEAGEGIDKIICAHLSTMMEFHPLTQMKGPYQPIVGRLPGFSNTGDH